MEHSENGIANTKGKLEDKMKTFKALHDHKHSFIIGGGWISTPNLGNNKRVYYKVLQYQDLIDSSDMNFEKYQQMAKTVEDNYDLYDSFILIHGTDTLEYTASYLSFMFENINKTFLITGSQIPLGDPKNDASNHLLGCFRVISTSVIPEVCVYFRDCLLRGNRTKKVDSENLTAFNSPSFPPLGDDHIELKVNWDLVLRRPPKTEKFKVHYVSGRLTPEFV